MSQEQNAAASGSDFLTLKMLVNDEVLTVHVSREALRDRKNEARGEAEYDGILLRQYDAIEAVAECKVRLGEQEDDGSVRILSEDFVIHRVALR